ncbi:lytic transglycosylase domain-containing protein [Acidithiobacillus acidisediminis]|uniref:lytic transglycosylase domain-containing protein n=1 Tax=Acidithiobacillus acidisediminis TaxID=2937799 RepID=UPI00200F99A6|nr:lytic transglycosylase domain-containing protein [Acidithiobacillus sp. S30A2]
MILPALIQQCAPQIAPATMTAIVRVESGGNPLAMWNNTTRNLVIPSNRQQAIAYLRQAIASGQRVDVGLAQVDTENFATFGLTPATAFDACTNLRAGAQILTAAYRRAVATFGPGQSALYHAFEAYNSGRLWGDGVYARRILAAFGHPFPLGAGGVCPLSSPSHGRAYRVETVRWNPGRAHARPEPSRLAYVLTWGPITRTPSPAAP